MQAPCSRCGGAGGSAHWPGYTCFRCGGEGIDPTLTLEKAEAIETARVASSERFAEAERIKHEEYRSHMNQSRVERNPALAGIERDELWSGLAKELFYRAELKTLSDRQLNVIFKEIKRIETLKLSFGIAL